MEFSFKKTVLFHRRAAEIAEGDCVKENREISILHMPQAFGQKVPRIGLKAFVCSGSTGRNKTFFLCVLSASAVKTSLWASMTYCLNAFLPANLAEVPNSSSMRNN